MATYFWRPLAFVVLLTLLSLPAATALAETEEEAEVSETTEAEETSPAIEDTTDTTTRETAMVTAVEPPREERATPAPPSTSDEIEARTVEEIPAVENAPEPITFRPPLSLNECLQLIEILIQSMPEVNSEIGPQDEVPSGSLIRMIDAIYGYLNFRDDLHTSLAHYEWMRLGETRVADPGETPDRDSLHFDAPVRNLSALSLAVDRGDVYLHGLWVYDETGQERQQFLFDPPRRLRHSLPRMEVFHLWRRTEVSRIELKYSRVESMDRSPKVFVRGGVTNRREYIKTALYNLKKEAEPAIYQGRYADARLHLQSARSNINDYIRQNRRSN